MNNLVTLVALLGLTANSFALAADTKSDTASTPTATTTDSTARSNNAHQGHGHIESMKAVTSLSSLTDKQKQQINDIYEKNKAQFESLQNQMRTLRETEWAQVKPLLTPEQLTELRKNHPGHHKKNAIKPGADAADKQNASPAPAEK